MRSLISGIVVGAAIISGSFASRVGAQTTQPLAAEQSSASDGKNTAQPQAANLAPDFELRTMQTFANKEWKKALPMLQKLIAAPSTKPEKIAQLQEYVRVCQRNIADPAAGAAFDPRTMLATAGDPPTAPDKRKVHEKPAADQTLALTIKELGNFDYDSDHGGNIPKDVLALNGSKIQLNGYMLPLDQAERITNFALVPSVLSCCFGQPPAIQHTIIVHTPAGKAVSYYPDEIVCEGTLTVQEKKDDEFIVSVFELSVNSVKPAVR